MRFIQFSLLFFSTYVFAEPYRYVLEGEIRSIYGDTYVIDNLEVSRGDYVRYVFLIDTEEIGYTDYLGNIECHDDYFGENESRVNFYAELIEISYQIDDTYYGFEDINYVATTIDDIATFPGGPFTRLTIGPSMLYFDTSPIEMWQVGEIFGAAHWWHDSATEVFHTMHMDLKLVEIEPSTLLLDHSACREESNLDAPDPAETTESSSQSVDTGPQAGGCFNQTTLFFLLLCAYLKNRRYLQHNA